MIEFFTEIWAWMAKVFYNELPIKEAFSSVCLTVVLVTCLSGILSRHYRDNWFQFLGMAAIIMWAAGRLYRLVDDDFWPITLSPLLHGGLAAYALGTAMKVVKHAHDNGHSKTAGARE